MNALKERQGQVGRANRGRSQFGHAAIDAGIEDSVPEDRQESFQDLEKRFFLCFRSTDDISTFGENPPVFSVLSDLFSADSVGVRFAPAFACL
jgi:hypothetical protein